MAFCYVNALFKDTIKCDCPVEVVKIITCYAKSMRLFKSVNDQLNLCPRMAQFEEWEKEAKAFPNMKELRERLLQLVGNTYLPRISQWDLMPHRVGGITRWMLETRYVNQFVIEHITNRITRFQSDLMKKKKEMYFTPQGVWRAYSRNPFISRHQDRHNVKDWIKMLVLKDNNPYILSCRFSLVSYSIEEENGVMRPRR
jgi:hypothetical protein